MIDTSIYEAFSPISLDDTNQVKLMNRVDSKYVVNTKILQQILNHIRSDYAILEINHTKALPYESLYWDTRNDNMYKMHHNGKLNRYKIRFRKYITSNEVFLEIKYKHKGIRTIKKRILLDSLDREINSRAATFILENSPFSPPELEPKIYTNFNRLTLVNKNLSERVTVDLGLNFHANEKDKFQLNNTAIIETKKDAYKGDSKITEVLHHFGINPSGMSKYCLGRAALEQSLKSNLFKEKLLLINKIEDGKFYYRNYTSTTTSS